MTPQSTPLRSRFKTESDLKRQGHSALGLDLEISCRVLIMSGLLHASRGHTYDPGRQRMTRQDQQPR